MTCVSEWLRALVSWREKNQKLKGKVRDIWQQSRDWWKRRGISDEKHQFEKDILFLFYYSFIFLSD